MRDGVSFPVEKVGGLAVGIGVAVVLVWWWVMCGWFLRVFTQLRGEGRSSITDILAHGQQLLYMTRWKKRNCCTLARQTHRAIWSDGLHGLAVLFFGVRLLLLNLIFTLVLFFRVVQEKGARRVGGWTGGGIVLGRLWRGRGGGCLCVQRGCCLNGDVSWRLRLWRVRRRWGLSGYHRRRGCDIGWRNDPGGGWPKEVIGDRYRTTPVNALVPQLCSHGLQHLHLRVHDVQLVIYGGEAAHILLAPVAQQRALALSLRHASDVALELGDGGLQHLPVVGRVRHHDVGGADDGHRLVVEGTQQIGARLSCGAEGVLALANGQVLGGVGIGLWGGGARCAGVVVWGGSRGVRLGRVCTGLGRGRLGGVDDGASGDALSFWCEGARAVCARLRRLAFVSAAEGGDGAVHVP